MKKFDIAGMKAHRYDQRDLNIFYKAGGFKMRVIELAPGESMPQCDMASHVIFVGIRGKAEVVVGRERLSLSRGECLVTEPAALSMKTNGGVRLLGIQIAE